MAFQIEDGKGTADRVQVNKENRLQVTAAMKPLVAHRSGYDGSAFGISTPQLTITTTGGRALYFKNTSSTQLMHISDLWLSWDGGSSSFNTPMYCQMVFGDTAPDTNITASAMGNLNRTFSALGDGDVLVWDETGDGMTGHSAGTPAFYWLQGQGVSHFDVKGAVILGLNDTVSFNLQAGDETGEATVNVLCYFNDKTEV